MKNRVLVAVSCSVALSASLGAQTQPGEAQQRRRNHIHLMEGVLTRAVRQGAEQVGQQLQRVDPTSTVLTGDARARGFLLDGYGVFFDVEIPSLVQSVVWSTLMLQRDTQVGTALDSLRRVLESLPDGSMRQQAQQAFKQVEVQVGPVKARNAMPLPGAVAAANTRTTAVESPLRPMEDPDAHYTDAVKNALIDAMLDYSIPMELGPDEWLTVAARDSDGPTTPGQLYDAHTIILRVKGSDLAAFHGDRSKREEARAKVQVRDF